MTNRCATISGITPGTIAPNNCDTASSDICNQNSHHLNIFRGSNMFGSLITVHNNVRRIDFHRTSVNQLSSSFTATATMGHMGRFVKIACIQSLATVFTALLTIAVDMTIYNSCTNSSFNPRTNTPILSCRVTTCWQLLLIHVRRPSTQTAS